MRLQLLPISVLLALVATPAPTKELSEFELDITAQAVFFEKESAELGSDARTQLVRLAHLLHRKYPDAVFIVYGHRDVDEKEPIGLCRANAVAEYLQALELDAGRMRVDSFGDEYASETGHEIEGAYPHNRRAELFQGTP